ncbi:4a-hydroxytetrahydrobiopterin dehydratase [Candidatus Neptunochlamydia vexilliferae]|uniref:Putative pterin-4-alpha-carbinolamine dehydratase n=1 Tax=Candidatus Neptunichlamydia vexilliferae TaxID=1651774 RepID=A0ABS0B1D1_9BACT|nr:4a-hydroxytetrahydrobiopterin dehydratase [Candidatus Neptunochlamydia vexilliferae]MBF5060194.1 putative pterin-4-alpha-carbinolamine dehydratase [Candidatus Neptunochlamydia vexilliferae]
MSDLTQKKCVPCTIGGSSLKGEALKPLAEQLAEGWEVIEEHHLFKEYSFKNFKEALAFTNIIGRIAEEEGHHPDILLTWGKVALEIWTHKVGGLTESDFILAAKIEAEHISQGYLVKKICHNSK